MEPSAPSEGSPAAGPVFGDSWRADWRATLGPAWVPLLVAFAICLFVGGSTVPLNDADFPMHLALGEWIARHGAVPFVEPFAWTRPGAPFYAYSWGAELFYYAVLSALGPTALQMVHGAWLVLTALSIVVLGAVLRWRGWTTLVVTAVHILVAVGIVPSLRPQGVLTIVVPLAWAFAVYLRGARRAWLPLVGLFACAAVAANSHLFFPLVAIPGIALLTAPHVDRRRVGLAAGVILAGWLCSPYGLHWADVFRLNFGENALSRYPSPVDEFTPGFPAFVRGGGTALLISPLLAALPWLVGSRLSGRERWWYGLAWLAGVFGFGIAIRSLLPWWLMMLPLVGMAVGTLASPTTALVVTTQRALVVAVFLGFSTLGGGLPGDPWDRAGDVRTRHLPSVAAAGIEPIAQWLDCALRPESSGKLLTTFNFGSYVTWRLPKLSASIDGRTIFPDSVASAEDYFLPVRRTVPFPPWRSADLALVPLSYPVAGVLDTASGWRRIAITADRAGPASVIGLWAREQWWPTVGVAPLPDKPLLLFHRAVPAACHQPAA